MLIELDDITIGVLRKPIKNMYLRINSSTGEVTVTAPLRLPISTIQTQLQSKRAWIKKARERVKLRRVSSDVTMMHGEVHYFMGTPYVLVVEPCRSSMDIVIEKGQLYGFVESQTIDERKKCLQTWYKQQMQALIPELIQKWEPIIGVSVYAWGIKKMKTRWGSCNVVAHRIWLNLSLIQRPKICLEYVLVHEMVHLLEANHSPRFHALMTRFMPQWREYKKQLDGSAGFNHCSEQMSSL